MSATQLHCGMYMQVCSRNQVERVTFEEVSKWLNMTQLCFSNAGT